VGRGGEVPVFYRRHFTHYTPRDFDLSPYFRIVKPTLEQGFDYRLFRWGELGGIAESAEQGEKPPIGF
jgi:hypothetical protein